MRDVKVTETVALVACMPTRYRWKTLKVKLTVKVKGHGHLNFRLRLVLAFGESDSAEANTGPSHWFCEYRRENEFLSKTIFACLLGAQMASIHDIKNENNLVALHL